MAIRIHIQKRHTNKRWADFRILMLISISVLIGSWNIVKTVSDPVRIGTPTTRNLRLDDDPHPRYEAKVDIKGNKSFELSGSGSIIRKLNSNDTMTSSHVVTVTMQQCLFSPECKMKSFSCLERAQYFMTRYKHTESQAREAVMNEDPKICKNCLQKRISASTAQPLPTNQKGIIDMRREAWIESPSPHTSNGIILTCYFHFATDPRMRNKPKHKPTFETIYHFWNSVIHNKLRAIIFYDDYAFDQEFVTKYSKPPYITFEKVDTDAAMSTNPNDVRFTAFAQFLKDHPNEYRWYVVADRDMIFNRDPFPKLDWYHQNFNKTFFGSYDMAKSWNSGAQGLQFRECYGNELTDTFRQDVEWKTPNGCTGLWAGDYQSVQCILECMSNEFNTHPVAGKGQTLPCDMAVHDYCVFYGGCFPNSTKGKYTKQSDVPNLLWGSETQGQGNDLFGIPLFGHHNDLALSLSKSWSVIHYRESVPLCFNHSTLYRDGPIEKYHQYGWPKQKECHLDPETDLPRTSQCIVIDESDSIPAVQRQR